MIRDRDKVTLTRLEQLMERHNTFLLNEPDHIIILSLVITVLYQYLCNVQLFIITMVFESHVRNLELQFLVLPVASVLFPSLLSPTTLAHAEILSWERNIHLLNTVQMPKVKCLCLADDS